jgi:hypothetical protein
MTGDIGVKEVPKVPRMIEPTIIQGHNNQQARNGEDIDANYMGRVKMGEGFSLASFILGLLAVVISLFSFMYSYGSGGIFIIQSITFSLAAIGLGLMGTKMQRMVTNKFGFGIAGALLGFIAILTTILTIALGGLFWNNYYDALVGALL